MQHVPDAGRRVIPTKVISWKRRMGIKSIVIVVASLYHMLTTFRLSLRLHSPLRYWKYVWGGLGLRAGPTCSSQPWTEKASMRAVKTFHVSFWALYFTSTCSCRAWPGIHWPRRYIRVSGRDCMRYQAGKELYRVDICSSRRTVP